MQNTTAKQPLSPACLLLHADFQQSQKTWQHCAISFAGSWQCPHATDNPHTHPSHFVQRMGHTRLPGAGCLLYSNASFWEEWREATQAATTPARLAQQACSPFAAASSNQHRWLRGTAGYAQPLQPLPTLTKSSRQC